MKKRRRPKKPIALTDRDKAIVLAVCENRFLRRDQIQRLFFPDSSLPACNMRLKKLYENRFLDRLYKPVAVGSSQAVYALDKRGAEIVARILEVPLSRVNWSRQHNRVEWFFMEHTLAVSEFKVNLDLALQERPRLHYIFYQRGNKSLTARVLDPGRKKKYLVVLPDAFFGIERESGKSYFYLEVDLGTETLARFAEKIVAYKQYWKSGKYNKDFGYKNFRVLTVAESERRMTNLIDATRKVGGKNMFLFATFTSIDQQTVFGHIWLSPISSLPISLLE